MKTLDDKDIEDLRRDLAGFTRRVEETVDDLYAEIKLLREKAQDDRQD